MIDLVKQLRFQASVAKAGLPGTITIDDMVSVMLAAAAELEQLRDENQRLWRENSSIPDGTPIMD